MRKEPLYRKVNTKARGVHHHSGPDARHERNTKEGISSKMTKSDRRGLDYTPLYKFMISKVGQDFDKVFSEAISRLDKEDPIYHIVDDKREYMMSENAIFPTLKVDENNILQLVNPSLKNEDFSPSCPCCTHTFNGKALVKKYSPNRPFTV